MFDVGEMVHFPVEKIRVVLWDVESGSWEGNVVEMVKSDSLYLILECGVGEYKVLSSNGVVGWVGEKWMCGVEG